MSIWYEKMAQAGFTPSQRALEADEYIKSRNRFDHPDEFQFVGSSVGGPDGYIYIGPARFYTSGSEYAAWLNSGLGQGPESYADGNAVAQAIDDNPAVPESPLGPVTEYPSSGPLPPSFYNTNTGMFTGEQAPNNTTQTPAATSTTQTPAATSGNNNTGGSTNTTPPAQPTGPTAAQVNALYQQYLGRDAEQAGLDYWMNSGGTLADLEYNISMSPEAQEYKGETGPTTVVDTFPTGETTPTNEVTTDAIYALYQQYLGRNPELAGLNYWLNSGGTLANLENNISMSPEAQQYAASQAQTGTGVLTGGVNIGGGSFTPGTPQGLSYSPMQLPSVAPAPSVQNVDYAQMIRGALTNSLFQGLV